jgi:hypothetical protein
MAEQPDEVAGPPTLLDIDTLLNKTAVKLLISPYPLIKVRLTALRAASALTDTPDARNAILDLLRLTGLPMDGVCSSTVTYGVRITLRDYLFCGQPRSRRFICSAHLSFAERSMWICLLNL